jgi:hypothetical protein
MYPKISDLLWIQAVRRTGPWLRLGEEERDKEERKGEEEEREQRRG